MTEILEFIEHLKTIKATLNAEPSGPTGDSLRHYLDVLINEYEDKIARFENEMKQYFNKSIH